MLVLLSALPPLASFKIESEVSTPHVKFVASSPTEVEEANGYQYPANDHVMSIIAQSVVKPRKVDHVMEILKLEHQAALKEHEAGLQLNVHPKPEQLKVDPVKEIIKMEREVAKEPKQKKVDHVMEILKLEHQAALNEHAEQKKVDPVKEIIKMEHAEHIQAESLHTKRPDAVVQGHAAALNQKIDRVMEVIKMEHKAVLTKGIQSKLKQRHQSIQRARGKLIV